MRISDWSSDVCSSDLVARIAHPFVAFITLGELFVHERPRGARYDLGIETRRRLVVKVAVTPDEAAFEERGADREVVLRRAHHLVERAARMADLQPEIPQSIKLRLDHLLGPACLLERGEEADVDIAVRRHFAAAIAADRDQRDALARRAVGRGIEMAGGEIMRSEEHTSELQSLMR